MSRVFALALAASLALSGCATTSTVTTAAMIDTDKAIIVAQDGYHLAAVAAETILADPATSPAVRAAIHAADDKAVTALHAAYKARTSTAVALAVTAIADFQTLTGSK